MTLTAEDAAALVSTRCSASIRRIRPASIGRRRITRLAWHVSQGLKIGVPREFSALLQPDVEAAVRAALGEVRKSSAPPGADPRCQCRTRIPVYYVIAQPEASSNLGASMACVMAIAQASSGPEGHDPSIAREGFGDEPKRRIRSAPMLLSQAYTPIYIRR